MRLTEVEAAIETCEEHLNKAGAWNTEIEAFLARYLLVRIYWGFEEKFYKLIADRSVTIVDEYAAAFVRATTSNVLRGLTMRDLKGYLAKFGDDRKEMFRTRIENTEAQRAYDSIVENRRITAHGAGALMTFQEVKSAYRASLEVLSAFGGALGLEAEE